MLVIVLYSFLSNSVKLIYAFRSTLFLHFTYLSQMELVNIYSVLCSHVILHTEHAHYFVSQSGAVCFCSVLLGDKAYFFYFSGKTYRQTVPSNASLGCQYT